MVRKSRFNKELNHMTDLITAIIVAVGLILFWRGIWDASKVFIGPYDSIALGLAILIFTGMATRTFLFQRR